MGLRVKDAKLLKSRASKYYKNNVWYYVIRYPLWGDEGKMAWRLGEITMGEEKRSSNQDNAPVSDDILGGHHIPLGFKRYCTVCKDVNEEYKNWLQGATKE